MGEVLEFGLVLFFSIMIIIIIASFIWEVYNTLKEDNLKLNLEKEPKNLYDYKFPELLKQRYMKERGKSEADFELVQLALKDWFSIFAGSTSRTDFYDFPSKEVDELWHMFIIFTADYRMFCQKFLGQFLDHVPLEDSKEVYPANANLKNLMRTFQAVKNKNDGLLFKIDDMFMYKGRSKYNYSFMSYLEEMLNKLPPMRTVTEGEELYRYGLITYIESREMINAKPVSRSSSSSSYSSSSSRTAKTSKYDDDFITSSTSSTSSTSCGSSHSSSSSSSCGSSCGSSSSCGS